MRVGITLARKRELKRVYIRTYVFRLERSSPIFASIFIFIYLSRSVKLLARNCRRFFFETLRGRESFETFFLFFPPPLSPLSFFLTNYYYNTRLIFRRDGFDFHVSSRRSINLRSQIRICNS